MIESDSTVYINTWKSMSAGCRPYRVRWSNTETDLFLVQKLLWQPASKYREGGRWEPLSLSKPRLLPGGVYWGSEDFQTFFFLMFNSNVLVQKKRKEKKLSEDILSDFCLYFPVYFWLNRTTMYIFFLSFFFSKNRYILITRYKKTKCNPAQHTHKHR